ncbi:alcohol dehydrogenase catalytic domain-containing protein [Providencia alcalifaciens]|uniref:zinc-dependent alcohol dehydrogenase n=1 Tax=Providencia alcalifaciens TaxID=126385 RepID=UPI0015D0B847|nr:alcohol dehydrogenase catalytic domain-containing protein [Providencia alcalifaciens]MBF0693131.1 alcohol dehydrogenase catalytic domain-containing protein [Providencia alcalifaciens]NYS91635.1 alcohol dehydrogenase catalytic domain-containing protein [Providencia alcalifaciens]
MRSLKFFGPWNVAVTETEDLTCLAEDDVIIDIAVCGICGTDIGIISGDYSAALTGTTLGHEASGVVTKIGTGVTQLKLGDRVVVNPTYSCNKCRMCLTGNSNHCEMKVGTEAGVSYDGAFADQYRAKEAFLRKVDDKVTLQAASLTEPLSCTITGVDKLGITHTNIRAVVIGAGTMGMLYLWVLYQRGIRAFLVEKDHFRYQFSQQNSPPNTPIYKDFVEALEQEYGVENRQIDLVVDTTGQLTELAFKYLAPGGKILNIALKDKVASFDIMKIADKSLSIIGSIDSLNNSFERAYIMIRDGEIPVEKLISHQFDLDDYLKAFKIVGCDINAKSIIPSLAPNCKVLLRLSSEE